MLMIYRAKFKETSRTVSLRRGAPTRHLMRHTLRGGIYIYIYIYIYTHTHIFVYIEILMFNSFIYIYMGKHPNLWHRVWRESRGKAGSSQERGASRRRRRKFGRAHCIHI